MIWGMYEKIYFLFFFFEKFYIYTFEFSYLFIFFREKLGGGKTSSDHELGKSLSKNRFGDTEKNKKDR